MAYSKTPRARVPTEKAAAYAKKKAIEDSDDDDEDDAKPDSVKYSKKSEYHDRLKQYMLAGKFVASDTLRQLYELDPDYKKFKKNSLRGAFSDLKNELLCNRKAIEAEKASDGKPKRSVERIVMQAQKEDYFSSSFMDSGGGNSPKTRYEPTVVQAVAEEPSGVKKLMVLVSVEANITNKSYMNVKVNDDGTQIEISRPRGQAINDMDFVEMAMKDDGGRNIDSANIALYIGALNKSLIELRGKKKSTAPFDTATIQLLEPVYDDKIVMKLYGCPDRTLGLLVMMRCKSSVEYMSSDDSDGEVVDYSSAEKKRKTNDYNEY